MTEGTTTRLPVRPDAVATPAGADLDRIARELARAVEGEVRFGLHDRMLYATDASIYQVEPLGVVIPASIEDAIRAVQFCAEHRVPILPRGGGTSLAGQCVNRAVVIDFSSRCNHLLGVDPRARRCRVQPGITVDDLNDQIRETGLFFAPDPATARQANVGGCIGNNAAGAHSILYGRTSENVLGVEACLADGRRVTFDEGAATRDELVADITRRVVEVVRDHDRLIRDRFPRTLRRSAGYQLDEILKQLDQFGDDPAKLNLAPLMCGSEGTLALTLAAELCLHDIPRAKGLAVIAFDSIDDAIGAVLPLLELKPAAIELLDDLIIDLARKNPQCSKYVELLPTISGRTPQAVLYTEFFGADVHAVAERCAEVIAIFPAGRVQSHVEPRAMADAWALRKAGEPLLHAIAGHRKPLGFVEDNAVPPENLAQFVREFRKIVESKGTIASFYAHASVGVLHVRPLLDLKDPLDVRRMQEIAVEAAHLAKSLGGVMSGEHGDGRARGPLLEDYFGAELMEAFRRIKAIFDPHNLLNPGAVVSPGPIESIAQQVRVNPKGVPVNVPEIDTFYDYADQDGFGHAVEACNGAGVCRKKQGGTMCPSYMGTLDERHSTRGRGNALRLALTGQLDLTGPARPAWNDAETLATLDLCLSCKACKSECPSNVDIARLKSEYLAQGYRTKRPPLRVRAMADIDRASRLASIAPGLVNAINRFPPTRAILNAAFGLHPKRSLPPFARPLHKRWGGDDPSLPAGAPVVALLADTFVQYNEPEIALATRRVLGAFGYHVTLVRCDDFQRAHISLGMLPEAIVGAERTLDRLAPLINDDSLAGLIVIEPSCLSAIADDWVSLRINRPIELRRKFARRAELPEQFLARRWDKHPRRPSFREPEGRVVLHAHCHQKALWGADSSAAVLRLALGEGTIDVLDAGCCGMAGAFGFSRHRFDLSMRIGGRALLPAASACKGKHTLLATGTSCRHQIKDGAGVNALHPIRFLSILLQ
ncbi:MAG: FAD-linked oxidase C-terminal domain-containing protein [Phycisphaerales bacterium]